MDTIVCSLGKSFYFCTVKNLTQHVIAAKSSAYRVTEFKEKLYPNDGGSSNAHKGSALDTLTHRIGVLLLSKI